MKNIGYVFRRLLSMNYGAMLKKINQIHKKTGKSRLFIFRDMKTCAVNYGAGYMDYDLFEMYNLTAEQYLAKCTAYYSTGTVKISVSDAWFKSLPCSDSTCKIRKKCR